MKLRHLNDSASKRWVDSLLFANDIKSRVAAQKEFLSALLGMGNNDFVKFVEASIAKYAPGGASAYVGREIPHQLAAPDPAKEVKLIPGHMYMMPADDVLRFYDYWGDVGRLAASCPTFWGSTTLAAVSSEYIKEPIWLCIDKNGDDSMARRQVEIAVREASALRWDPSSQRTRGHKIGIDGLTRRALRWMMGPVAIRGTPTMYANCSLAKAWWCGWFAELCSATSKDLPIHLDRKTAVIALKWMWQGLAEYMAGRLPILREQAVLTALAFWATERLEHPTRGGFTARDSLDAFELLGEISESRALGLLDAVTILSDIIKQGLPDPLAKKKT